MSSTLFEVTITHVGGREEIVRCGWTYGPKDGVLHLHEVEGEWDRPKVSRGIVLANIVGYAERRLL